MNSIKTRLVMWVIMFASSFCWFISPGLAADLNSSRPLTDLPPGFVGALQYDPVDWSLDHVGDPDIGGATVAYNRESGTLQAALIFYNIANSDPNRRWVVSIDTQCDGSPESDVIVSGTVNRSDSRALVAATLPTANFNLAATQAFSAEGKRVSVTLTDTRLQGLDLMCGYAFTYYNLSAAQRLSEDDTRLFHIDGSGSKDMPNGTGGDTEDGATDPECSNGQDDDTDGLVDSLDSGCEMVGGDESADNNMQSPGCRNAALLSLGSFGGYTRMCVTHKGLNARILISGKVVKKGSYYLRNCVRITNAGNKTFGGDRCKDIKFVVKKKNGPIPQMVFKAKLPREGLAVSAYSDMSRGRSGWETDVQPNEIIVGNRPGETDENL